MSDPQRPTIAAVVACYRDAEALPEMHRRLSASLGSLGVEYQIVLVNDGSPDSSGEIIQRLSAQDPRVLGVNHSRNFGSQMAFRSGMSFCEMESVVLLDGDLQDPPEVIPELYYKMVEGFDVVYGVRVRREMGRLKEALYKLFYRVYSASADFAIPRDAGDFAIVSKQVMDTLLLFREKDLFLRGLRAYVGFRQTGISYIRPERPFGRSTNSIRKNLDWARSAIFSSSSKPLKLITDFGFIVFAISALVGVALVLDRFFITGQEVPGITLLATMITGFGGLTMLSLGVIGEYISKILIEVKDRPAPIVVSTVEMGRLVAPQSHR